MEGNGKSWYAIHTYSGYEDRVKKNLEQRVKFMDSGEEIAQVIVPTEEEVEIRAGQRKNISKKILPGYILVEMNMTDSTWNIHFYQYISG